MSLLSGGLSKVIGGVADLLLPQSCALCGELLDHSKPPVCPICREGFEEILPPVCQRCGQPYQGAGVCPDCRQHDSALVMLRSGFAFGGSMSRAITRLKYGHQRQLAPYLARILANELQPEINFSSYDLLVAVPLHRKRLAERGFNQSALLARELGAALQIETAPQLLRRTRPTPSQSKTHGRRQRAENLRGAFTLRAGARIAGKRICLVDDVVTSGATLEACGLALKAARPTSITGITLARTLHS